MPTRLVLFGLSIMLVITLCHDTFARDRSKHKNKPIQAQDIRIDPAVLREHQKRFGSTQISKRYLEKFNKESPKIVESQVGKPQENLLADQIIEIPVLPKMIGNFEYRPKYKWGRQPTLKELLKTHYVPPPNMGPRKDSDPEYKQFREAWTRLKKKLDTEYRPAR